MKKMVLFFSPFIIIFGILYCSIKKPTEFDGKCKIHIFVIDTTGTALTDSMSGLAPVADAKVQLFSQEYILKITTSTNEKGEAIIEDLLASEYIISVSKKIAGELSSDSLLTNKEILLNGTAEKTIYKNQESETDTIKLSRKILSKIVINEVYYCGSSSNNGNYQYDQFVELFNPSESTQYLDKLILAKASARETYKNNYVEANYVFQFPGAGREFPIAPGEFVVVAHDAINHIIKANADSSIDLSKSNWEFYNQYGDINNQVVQDLVNINPNKQYDFLLNIKYGGLALINGKDIDQLNFNFSGYVLFDFKDVMDAVEYSRDLGNPKIFSNSIETGIAGNGLLKYSGKSIERENPIDGAAGYDSDNSSLDFKNTDSPTPGYQHGFENVSPGGKF